MTFQQIIRALTLELDKVDSITLPEITLEMKLYYLNKAILRKVTNLFSGLNKLNKGFEENSYRVSELQKLVTESSNLISTTSIANVYKSNCSYYNLDLPSDYLFYVKNDVWLKVKKKYCNDYLAETISEMNIVQLDDLDKYVTDPFNKPFNTELAGSFINNKLRIYFDSTCKVTKVILTYLKEPQKITGNTTTVYSDLNDFVLNQIVTDCVSDILEAVESSRLQTIPFEISKTD